jgi:hypothetical protein
VPVLRRRWLLLLGLIGLVWLVRSRRPAPPAPVPDRAPESAACATAAPRAAPVSRPAPGVELAPPAVAGRQEGARSGRRFSRAAAFLALTGAVAAYYAGAERLPDIPLWWEVAVLSLAVIPVVLALVPVALPAQRSSYLLPAVLVLAGLTVLLEARDIGTAANFVKLAAVTGAGWFFLRFFEEVSWVVLVAVLIIPVDIFSVARGPTKKILEAEPEVFDRLSVAFPVPGEHASARLGLPDVLFFALFLGAADRFGLRLRLTWLACTLSFGATLPLAVWLDVSGLPALPLLSAAFVLANGDLLWRRLRRRPAAPAA